MWDAADDQHETTIPTTYTGIPDGMLRHEYQVSPQHISQPESVGCFLDRDKAETINLPSISLGIIELRAVLVTPHGLRVYQRMLGPRILCQALAVAVLAAYDLACIFWISMRRPLHYEEVLTTSRDRVATLPLHFECHQKWTPVRSI